MFGFLDKMVKPRISVVIPAYNEAMSVGEVVANCKAFCDEIIVVDDGSTDDTAEVARNSGAEVVRNEKNLGITKAVQRGLEAAHGNIIVTMDADGQHDPTDIPKLIKPIIDGKADVVLGVREEIPNRSERIINVLANLGVRCSDTGTGFRAIRSNIAKKMKLRGTCLCGTFVLEAHKRGATIMEVSIKTKRRIYGKSKANTEHIRQFFYVLRDLIL
jgi:glycosyltransferase involved in cell wall biosynthesis